MQLETLEILKSFLPMGFDDLMSFMVSRPMILEAKFLPFKESSRRLGVRKKHNYDRSMRMVHGLMNILGRVAAAPFV